MLPGERAAFNPCTHTNSTPFTDHPPLTFGTELLRFSSASHLLEKIPMELQAHHRVVSQVQPRLAEEPSMRPPTTAMGRARQQLNGVYGTNRPQVQKQANIWDGWEDVEEETNLDANEGDQGEDDLDLNGLGL